MGKGKSSNRCHSSDPPLLLGGFRACGTGRQCGRYAVGVGRPSPAARIAKTLRGATSLFTPRPAGISAKSAAGNGRLDHLGSCARILPPCVSVRWRRGIGDCQAYSGERLRESNPLCTKLAVLQGRFPAPQSPNCSNIRSGGRRLKPLNPCSQAWKPPQNLCSDKNHWTARSHTAPDLAERGVTAMLWAGNCSNILARPACLRESNPRRLCGSLWRSSRCPNKPGQQSAQTQARG